MNKKIICAILIMPLIIMLIVYTTAKTVSLVQSVEVNSVVINDNDIEYIDMDLNDSFQIHYTVYPLTATNQNVTFEVVNLENDFEIVQISKTGLLKALRPGQCKITVITNSGNYKDSFILYISSKGLKSIDLEIKKEDIYVGDLFDVIPTLTPLTALNQALKFESSNQNVIKISQNGQARAMGKGEAQIKVSSIANPNVYNIIIVNVLIKDIIDFSKDEIITYSNKGSLIISIDFNEEYDFTLNYNNEEIKIIETIIAKDLIKIDYELKNDFLNTNLEAVLNSVSGFEYKKNCLIIKDNNISFGFLEDEVVLSVLGSASMAIIPSIDDVIYNVNINDNDVCSFIYDDNAIYVWGYKAGVTSVIVDFYINEELIESKELVIIIKPFLIEINNNAKTYGLSNEFYLGQYNMSDEKLSSWSFEYTINGTLNDDFYNYIKWSTSDSDIATVSLDGKIKILNTGVFYIQLDFIVNDVTYMQAKFKINAVKDGYNVGTYKELMEATKKEKIVILTNTIGSLNDGSKGEALFGSNYDDLYTTIDTTYDKTYYKNANIESNAKVKVLVDIKNDIYGNGYLLNAHNLAFGLDSTGTLKYNALFKGPLNFVSLTETQSSLISVKAQDNIAFAVRGNVNLYDLNLQSCDDQADLSKYNFVGTTVEILGDNVNINYCRIKNGRTVMRIFGSEDSNEVIRVNIENSILSNAREFIIRMGSNKFVDGNATTPSPYLLRLSDSLVNLNDFKNNCGNAKNYNNLTNEEKNDYDNNYITTFVTLNNVGLRTCGIFSIGIDTHFSGQYLADGRNNPLVNLFGEGFSNWYDLAKTSYGSKLILENEVRIYDWKNLESIDSSTLIEQNNSLDFSSYFDFNIKNMISSIYEDMNTDYTKILTNYLEEKYVHGGIAFFGGGKNYSVIEYKNYKTCKFEEYSINLRQTSSSALMAAAGDQSFYFLMYDKDSSFTPLYQDRQIEEGSMYNFIK